MSSPVPMPTARQAELLDQFREYLRLEREGPPMEALRTAVALVREEGLNPYHAAELHLKLAGIPEVGLDHASESVKIFTKLKETDNNRGIRWKLQEAENAMQEAQTIEKAWSQRLDTMTPEASFTAVVNRYNDYFSKYERDELSSRGTETEKLFEFEYPVKKGRTVDSGGEKEEKEKKKLEEYEEIRKFLTS